MMYFRDQERSKMSLWVDKHRPKRLSKLDYHQVRSNLDWDLNVIVKRLSFWGMISWKFQLFNFSALFDPENELRLAGASGAPWKAGDRRGLPSPSGLWPAWGWEKDEGNFCWLCNLLIIAPQKLQVMCLLREMYGAGVERLRLEHQTFTTPSKKKVWQTLETPI